LYFANIQNQSSSSGVEFWHDQSLSIYRKHGRRMEVWNSGDLKIKGKTENPKIVKFKSKIK